MTDVKNLFEENESWISISPFQIYSDCIFTKKLEILGNEKKLIRQEIFEEGKYKFLIKNLSKQNNLFLKSQIQLEYEYSDIKGKIESIESNEEVFLSFYLNISEIPCNFNLNFLNLNYFQKLPFEISLFQEFEMISEINENDFEKEEGENIIYKLKKELKFNGIYKIFIKWNDKNNLNHYPIIIHLNSFSYSQENIIFKNNFISPSFPFLKSDPSLEMDINYLKIKIENKLIGQKKNEKLKNIKILIVRLVESSNLINYISSQQKFRKDFQKSLNEKDIDLINELLQNEILKDLNFYDSIKEELKESKNILREMNELLNELKESNESLFEIRIKNSLNKLNLKFKNYDNFGNYLLKDSNNLLNIFKKKKELILEISKILQDETEDLKNLKILRNLKNECFEKLKFYKTDDFENEKDIEELTNTTILLLEEIEQLEIEKYNRQQNLLLNLERILLNENEFEIESFLKKNKHYLPNDIYQSSKLILHNLKHKDEIQLQNYLKETINNLNKKKLNEKNDSSSNHIDSFNDTKLGNSLMEKQNLDEKDNIDDLNPNTIINDDVSSIEFIFQNEEEFEKIKEGETLPTVLNILHKSVIKILKLINDEKKKRLFIVKPIEPFKLYIENILKSLFYLLNSNRMPSNIFKKSKSIIEIVKNFEKILVEDFYQLKYVEEIKNENDKILYLFIMYSLEKGRFVSFLKEILNEKKLYFTESSLFFNNLYSDELYLIFDMLNQIRFEFPEFQNERLNDILSTNQKKLSLKNEKIKVSDEKEVIKVISKKKKIKYSKLFIQQLKEFEEKLIEYYLIESKLRPSIEIGRDTFVHHLIQKDIINLFKQFFKDGLIETNYSNWEILSFISENDQFILNCFNKIEEEEEEEEREGDNDIKFNNFFKLLFNSSKVSKLFEIILNENEIFEDIYDHKSSCILSKNILNKIIKITSQMVNK
eukprot:gene5179-8785_t